MLLSGRVSGQTLIGGTAASENLTLSSTGNATKGAIIFGDSEYDELNNRLGLGTFTPTTKLHVVGASLTGSAATGILNLTQTWNTTGNPTAILLNITNTGSGTGANLMDLQVGGSSLFRVNKAGGFLAGGNCTINLGGLAVNSYITTVSGTPLTIGGLRTFSSGNAVEIGSFGTIPGSNISTFTASSGTQSGVVIRSNVNQSSSASFTDLLINRTETSIGSGLQNLIDLQVGGVSRFAVDKDGNIVIDTTTGTKIGTSTSQKIGLWNATPIVQPTTSVAAAAFVANSGPNIHQSSTFDGYTVEQVVKALRNIGILA
jgi:hypothetical protein